MVDRHHALLLCDDDAEGEGVRAIVSRALAAGEAVLLVAHASLRDSVARAFPDEARITMVDAAQTLAAFDGVTLDHELFRTVVQDIFAKARTTSSGGLTVVGTMVRLLWLDDRKDEAALLEQMWNGLNEEFNLVCTYPATGFGSSKNASLVCQEHSHLDRV